MILASDLDGTFLGGNQKDRLRLYNYLKKTKKIKLIYITGRGLENVMPLLNNPLLPVPDYIICDVGATVVHGKSLKPVQPIQSEIASIWPGAQAIENELTGVKDLVRQNVPQERRCSFFSEIDMSQNKKLKEVAKKFNCDILYSADYYLDFLPKGVNKGSTLIRLIEKLGIKKEQVMVAGDTMNDFSMYETGFKGVVVGRSEKKLVQKTKNMKHVYQASAAGAGGIGEAFVHYKWAKKNEFISSAPASSAGDAQLVMVYHRMPFEEVKIKGKVTRREPKSPNGILPTMVNFFREKRTGAWIAWSEADSRDPVDFERQTTHKPEEFPNLVISRIPLTKKDVEVFYKVFSKEAFWPILHGFIERAVFDESKWQHYVEINRIFAERTAYEADGGATVWIHDYNLWMVPGFLRQLRPDLKIAFFHHTPFPGPDIFNVIPWRAQILGSLLECDYIGFHIPMYVKNFTDAVRGSFPVKLSKEVDSAPRFLVYGCAVGIDKVYSTIKTGTRTVRLGSHPVGTSIKVIKEILEKPTTKKLTASLKQGLKSRTVILSVERLDYTKGPLKKLLAFEKLLEEHPEYRGKLMLVNVTTPASQGMAIYRTLQTQLEQTVGRINGKFSAINYTPVRFFFRALPFEQVVSYFSVADIVWVTPLRDGLNLVSKEYAAVQGLIKGTGQVLLSEFTGVAAELHGAILTNPYDMNDMIDSLLRTLKMKESEKRNRTKRMFRIVSQYEVTRWGNDFLKAIQGTK